MKKIDIRDIRSEEILAVNRGENTLFQRRENLSKHTSYARERMQYDAIRSGQVEQILSLLQQKPDGIEGILSKDQLRNSKNMFIAGITLFTRAAIDGGVPEETAKEALRLAMHKLPCKCKIVSKADLEGGDNSEN